jgi:hypothetical protein
MKERGILANQLLLGPRIPNPNTIRRLKYSCIYANCQIGIPFRGLFVQSYRLGTRELQIADVVVLARIVQAASLVPCSICRYVSLKRKDNT